MTYHKSNHDVESKIKRVYFTLTRLRRVDERTIGKGMYKTLKIKTKNNGGSCVGKKKVKTRLQQVRGKKDTLQLHERCRKTQKGRS